jgi:IS5 family transposase
LFKKTLHPPFASAQPSQPTSLRSFLAQVKVDATVQEKAISFPTDVKLMRRARERVVRLARAKGVALRHARVASSLGSKYLCHANQFKRANKALRGIRTLLGRVIRDIQRK